MSLTIPDDLLAAAHISEDEALQELAIALFQQERLTTGKAARLARMNKFAFQELLMKRKIPLYRPTIEDFEQDLATLRKLGQL
jgi:predicted HTH domain antitoxin